MGLAWQYGCALAAVLFITSRLVSQRTPRLGALAHEGGIIALLYSVWMYVALLSVLGLDGAVSRAEWIASFQKSILLPDELTLQSWVRTSSIATQAANLYYAVMHMSTMGVFLVWLYVRHRPSYPTWRNTLALTTGACLIIQLIPVAPPRLTPSTGLVDTGLEYGQSVYSALGYTAVGQYQAMPSIHVAWATVIAVAVWRVSPSRWRWIGPAHWAVTCLVVVVTGHHFWLDGIVAAVLVAMVYPIAVAAVKVSRTTPQAAALLSNPVVVR